MLFNFVGTIHTHLTHDERMAGLKRRAEWQYPPGVKIHSEIWRAAAPHIVTTFECDSYEPIMAIQLAWGDFMEMSVSPCTTHEQGLQTGAKLMASKK